MIRVSYEEARGCGFRGEGGIYLVSGGLAAPCASLPFELVVCRACNAGVKPARGWTWIEPPALLGVERAALGCGKDHCGSCPAGLAMPARAGLIWVGESFYPSVREFVAEARARGVSRKLRGVPRGFVSGETWVFLAHRKAIESRCSTGFVTTGWPCSGCEKCEDGIVWTPGIFAAFRPTVEKVVPDDTDEATADALRARGIEPVIVRPVQTTIAEAGK